MHGSPDSETEMYRQTMLQRHYAYRRHSRVLLVSGTSIFLAASIVLFGLLVIKKIPQYTVYSIINLGVLCFLVLASLVMIVLGIYFLSVTRRMVDSREVPRFRQQERRRLFREAQGRLPWGYRRTSRVVLFSASLIFVLVGSCILLLFGPSALDGWGYAVFGLMIGFVALFVLPRAGERARQESATRLAHYLMLGEIRVPTTADEVQSNDPETYRGEDE